MMHLADNVFIDGMRVQQFFENHEDDCDNIYIDDDGWVVFEYFSQVQYDCFFEKDMRSYMAVITVTSNKTATANVSVKKDNFMLDPFAIQSFDNIAGDDFVNQAKQWCADQVECY